MKSKFQERAGNILGITIMNVRKEKGLTQEALGKMVGMSKSGISKIENGLTHISAEDASILLEAMGGQLSIEVRENDMGEKSKEMKCRFVTIAVQWFAEAKQIAKSKAYNFLTLYKGIEFLDNNFRYEQTLPKEVIVNDLIRICEKNGGRL